MPAPAAMPRPRILVVDDEPLVGRAVKRVLSSQSDVSCSTSAAEALAILGDPANRFDLILCDLMMPDMNGPQFRSALLRLLPHMEHRLIFITGGAFTPDMDQFLAQSSCPYVLKPFDVPELRSLVASRLAAA